MRVQFGHAPHSLDRRWPSTTSNIHVGLLLRANIVPEMQIHHHAGVDHQPLFTMCWHKMRIYGFGTNMNDVRGTNAPVPTTDRIQILIKSKIPFGRHNHLNISFHASMLRRTALLHSYLRSNEKRGKKIHHSACVQNLKWKSQRESDID